MFHHTTYGTVVESAETETGTGIGIGTEEGTGTEIEIEIGNGKESENENENENGIGMEAGIAVVETDTGISMIDEGTSVQGVVLESLIIAMGHGKLFQKPIYQLFIIYRPISPMRGGQGTVAVCQMSKR